MLSETSQGVEVKVAGLVVKCKDFVPVIGSNSGNDWS